MLIETHISYKIFSDLPQSSYLLDFPHNLQRPNPDCLKAYPESALSFWEHGPIDPTHAFHQVPSFYSEEKYNTKPKDGKFFYSDRPERKNRNVNADSTIKLDPLSISPKKVFINHSFEPIRFEYDRYFWNHKHFDKTPHKNGLDLFPNDEVYIIHSEQNSADIKLIQDNIDCDIKFVHWFSHGYLCSKHWYNLQSPSAWDVLKPINSHFVCMNRIYSDNKTWRLQLLNKLDLSKGVYSLLEHCPQSGETPNQVLTNNTVKPYSFDWHGNDSGFVEVEKYTPINTSFLHVVNETLYNERKQHLTEKTFKPIVLMQPFVLAAPPGCLAYLKSYGFKTFDKWWDESYDTIEDDEQRLCAIADVVDGICKLSIDQLYDLQKEMSAALLHNRHLFYNGFGDKCYQELINQLSPG